MKSRFTPVVAFALAAGPALVSAAELGRLDLAAPAAMISTCGGLNYSGSAYGIGDKGWWLPGQVTCNAAQTVLPNASVAQSANHFSNTPAGYIDASAHGQTVMGQTKLYAHSVANPVVGFAQAEATGGWVDVLTLNPVNPADMGKVASFTFAIDVDGTLSGQGAVDSFNSMAGFGIKPYVNGASLSPGPGSEFAVGGQGQFGFPYNETVDQTVTFSADVTLGTPFELGLFARALAGNASSGYVYALNDATVDFSNTVSWAGISSVTVSGSSVAYTLVSASGIDWTQPYAAVVPEPSTWALWIGGLLGMGTLRWRKGSRAA